MESTPTPDEVLRATDRAAAAPWTDYPPTPLWYPPVTGMWAGLLVAVIGQRDAHPAITLAGLLGLVALEYAFVVWYRRYRGTMPASAPPEEFRAPIARLVLGVAAIVGLAWLTGRYVGLAAAAAVVAVLVTVLIAWYETAYAAAAAAARERLS